MDELKLEIENLKKELEEKIENFKNKWPDYERENEEYFQDVGEIYELNFLIQYKERILYFTDVKDLALGDKKCIPF